MDQQNQNRSPWEPEESTQLERYSLLVTDAYFGWPSFVKDKSARTPFLILAGEATTPEGRKQDWSASWGSGPGWSLGSPGDRSDFIAHESGATKKFWAKSDLGALNKHLIAKVEDGGAGMRALFESRDMWPNNAKGWVGLRLEIESRVVRNYESRDIDPATGEKVWKDATMAFILSAVEEGGAPIQGAATAPTTTTATPAANGQGNGSGPLSDGELLAMAQAAAGNYIDFLGSAVDASRTRGTPMAVNDPRLVADGPIWSAVRA